MLKNSKFMLLWIPAILDIRRHLESDKKPFFYEIFPFEIPAYIKKQRKYLFFSHFENRHHFENLWKQLPNFFKIWTFHQNGAKMLKIVMKLFRSVHNVIFTCHIWNMREVLVSCREKWKFFIAYFHVLGLFIAKKHDLSEKKFSVCHAPL
jgi:hypothetical protein